MNHDYSREKWFAVGNIIQDWHSIEHKMQNVILDH